MDLTNPVTHYHDVIMLQLHIAIFKTLIMIIAAPMIVAPIVVAIHIGIVGNIMVIIRKIFILRTRP